MGNSVLLFSSANVAVFFFQINFLEKILSFNQDLSELIWFQAVSKCYQPQSTLVGKRLT